jgi:hypothetical protein
VDHLAKVSDLRKWLYQRLKSAINHSVAVQQEPIDISMLNFFLNGFELCDVANLLLLCDNCTSRNIELVCCVVICDFDLISAEVEDPNKMDHCMHKIKFLKNFPILNDTLIKVLCSFDLQLHSSIFSSSVIGVEDNSEHQLSGISCEKIDDVGCKRDEVISQRSIRFVGLTTKQSNSYSFAMDGTVFSFGDETLLSQVWTVMLLATQFSVDDCTLFELKAVPRVDQCAENVSAMLVADDESAEVLFVEDFISVALSSIPLLLDNKHSHQFVFGLKDP